SLCSPFSSCLPHTERHPTARSQPEEKENQNFIILKTVSFKRQMVASLSFFIKVDAGDYKCVCLRLFKVLPHENNPLTLSPTLTNKDQQDKLTPVPNTSSFNLCL
uniref:Cystatin-B n=1 Tax=Peromyscus maniculatus bairdii TaxID=230844 RepID=A0A8C8UCE2_PERMB